MGAKYDPLEAVKIAPKGPRPTPVEAPAIADVATAPIAKPVHKKVEKPAVAEKKVMYKVLASTKISWRGHITHLAKDDMLDPRGYGGEPGMEKLRAQGVKLEKVE